MDASFQPNMEELSMCRICLAADVWMRLIANTHLQEVYESLTSIPLETKDRPMQVCYICYAKLENCFQLKNRCLRSEQLFQWFVLAPTELGHSAGTTGLTVTPVEHMSMGHTDSDQDEVKVEYFKAPETEPVVEDAGASREHIRSTGGVCLTIVKEEPADITSNALISEPPAPAVQMSSDASTSRTLEHTGEKYQASELFKVKRSLDPYRRTRKGEKPYQCEKCNKCFSRKPYLENHCRTHTGEKPYQCTECNKCFSQKSNLNHHSRIHTGEKPYQCEECQKCFSGKTSLSVHRRIHTGEKPFQCKVCNKYFSHKTNLDYHTRTHTGEKPFKCTDCDKCFSHKSNLDSHIRSHKGEKPFQCNECEKCFSKKISLKGHSCARTVEK